jgi:hypothetical protein
MSQAKPRLPEDKITHEIPDGFQPLSRIGERDQDWLLSGRWQLVLKNGRVTVTQAVG